jgi:plastocyanin
MKICIGFVILMIAFIFFTGCTQPAVQEAVTTPPTTIPTIVPTAEFTLAPTTLPTTVVTTVLPIVKRTTSPSTKVVTTIHMRNNTFVPQELTVLPGTGITWVNDDSAVHTVKTIGNATGMFNSGDIIPNSQWSYTFGEREGRYEFTCSYHPDMKGAVIIQKADTSLIRSPQIQATLTN